MEVSKCFVVMSSSHLISHYLSAVHSLHMETYIFFYTHSYALVSTYLGYFPASFMKAIQWSTYVKVHGSVSVDALQRKEAEESACGKLHDLAFKIAEIYLQEKLLCNLWVKNGNYWPFRLDFGNSNAQVRRNIPEVRKRSLMQREYHIRNYV